MIIPSETAWQQTHRYNRLIEEEKRKSTQEE